MDDFWKYCEENDLIRPVEEAFKEFLPEEEIHKGDINYFVSEPETPYGKYKTGDIVFVEAFNYQDGKVGKNHLFVIVGENNIAVPIEYICMLLSSKIEKVNFRYNKLLLKDNKNNLRMDSIVKTDYLYRVNRDQMKFKLGTVDIDTIEEYKKYLVSKN